MGTPCLPPPPSKSQILTYGAILLKFDTQHFHMFTNYKLCSILEFGVTSPSLLPLKNEIFFFVVWFCWKLKNKILNFEIEVPFSSLPPHNPDLWKLNSSFLVHFWSILNSNIFICLPLINKITIWKERKEKFVSDNVLDLVWDNHYDERSLIKSSEIPYEKL